MTGFTAPAGAEPAAALSEKAAPVNTDMKAFAGSRLYNRNSGKCALAQGAADNQPVVQFQCLQYADQFWTLDYKGDGRYQVRNINSNKCLLVRGTANEAPAVQFTCLDYVDQYWRTVPFGGVENGWYWLKNVNSGKCLIVRGGSDGTQLVQFDCAQYRDQEWHFL